ncbi:RNA polymerase factor sigma-54 [Geminicoccaceae bacterium 1502E]|nr:RNA polymerase factor sigma-54 [Geminicoccaceae bacterium 1502E]
MSLALRLDVRQSQSLVLTPQLQQAIRLLQLSNIELASVVERELSENPFLERAERSGTAGRQERERPLSGAPALAPGGGDGAESGWSPPAQPAAADQRLQVSRAAGGEQPASPDSYLAAPTSLAEHLARQLAGMALPPGVREAALALAASLDEDGYLREADDELAGQLGINRERVAAARAALLACEPAGLGARDLAQCLAAQLREQDRLDPMMQLLLDNLPLVARADLAGLQRACAAELEDVREMIAEIKRLDPRPGRSFTPLEPLAAIPDLLAARTGRGNWRVEINQATLPRVLVDRDYYASISSRCTDRAARDYASERWQAANWLAKALDQRARTLLKVGRAIFTRQIDFLEHGPRHLRPLVLRTIAEATGLHESTVSRATADKHAATPHGTVPLRYFFTTAIAGTGDGETHSAEVIRQQIRRLIEQEEPENVLSDDQIVAILKEGGVAIARRTVAKYRESLAIPSSVQRRRSKALML